MKVIGLMSGTSADGIDAALCEITGVPPALAVKMHATWGESYPQELHNRILSACHPGESSVEKLCLLNVELAETFSNAVLRLLDHTGLSTQDIDLIGSHGQTVWHSVTPDGRVDATLQLVEAAVIAQRTGITTISNFRARDVAAGGQGAPLTAYVDWLLLRHHEYWRAVQNIGGIANVTLLPPLSEDKYVPTAFDTGPGNVLINAAVYELTAGKMRYDHNGAMASRGQVDLIWLNDLLQHPYFERDLPKTTGRELFGVQMAQKLVQEGTARGLEAESIITTLTHFTAASIANAYRRFAPCPINESIIGGGGVHNPVLFEALRQYVWPTRVLRHEDIGMDSDYKEALVFAVLAYETWHARPGNHPALTSAQHPAILGQITPGNNYSTLIKQTWCSL